MACIIYSELHTLGFLMLPSSSSYSGFSNGSDWSHKTVFIKTVLCVKLVVSHDTVTLSMTSV